MFRYSWIMSAAAGLALCTGALGQTFHLLVTETPPGNNQPDAWGGVQHYTVDGSGGLATLVEEIPADQVADPAGLAIDPETSLFVGNRHGNQFGGSISRFVFDFDTGTFVPTETLSGNSLFGVHGLAFNPVNEELFACNYTGPVSRFTYVAACSAASNGTIGGGLTRGVEVSPGGDRLYVTTASNLILRYDLGTGVQLSSITVPGASSLHSLVWGPDGQLYAADIGPGKIFRYAFDVDQNPIFVGSVDGLVGAVDAAFSPDGQEMFVSSHTNGVVYRLAHDEDTGTWTLTDSIDAGTNLGAIEVFVPQSTPPCEGDANGDGAVDPLDSGFVQARFGCLLHAGDPCCDSADVNGDELVDPLDVGFVLSRLGACE